MGLGNNVCPCQTKVCIWHVKTPYKIMDMLQSLLSIIIMCIKAMHVRDAMYVGELRVWRSTNQSTLDCNSRTESDCESPF